MKKLQRVFVIACVTALTLGCMAMGIWVAHVGGTRMYAHLGLALFLGSIIAVPYGMMRLLNKVFRSEWALERTRQLQRVPRMKSAKLEQQLRHLRFMKHHPGVVLLFCLFALVVSTGMMEVERWAPINQSIQQHRQTVALHWMGIVLGAAYCAMLLLIIYARLTKRWESYMDSRITKVEARLSPYPARPL